MADPYPTSTTQVAHPLHGEGARRMRTRRISYVVGAVALTTLVGVAVVDGLVPPDVFGVGSATTTDVGGGYRLTVRYPTVTRPALASPFDVRVHRAGGFDGPVQLALDWEWLEMWDENAWYPSPSRSWGDGDRIVMEFDPPPGDVLRVIYDARIQPAQQEGHDGFVAVMDHGFPVVTVTFHTRVLP